MSKAVTVPVPDGTPVTAFEAGKWYRWVGPKKRRPYWNGNSDGTGKGEMDFILDGQPHLCSFGRGTEAKFPDSPDPNYAWNWKDGFEYFREVPDPTKFDVVARAFDHIGAAFLSSRPIESKAPVSTLVIESRADIRRRILGI